MLFPLDDGSGLKLTLVDSLLAQNLTTVCFHSNDEGFLILILVMMMTVMMTFDEDDDGDDDI